MNIVFFIRTLNNSGGTERITSILANNLIKQNHNVTVITWMGGDNFFFQLDKRILIKSIFKSNQVNIYTKYISTLWKYLKIKKKIKPDLIIDVCTSQSLISIPINIVIRSKVICWEHFNTTVKWNVITSDLSRWLVSKFADKVIVLTQTDKINYENMFNATNVVCVPNPIPIAHTKICDIEKKIVLSIGRFSNQKGFDLLLSVWKIITIQNQDWILQIIGDGELKAEIDQLRTKLCLTETVQFIAPTQEIENFYINASIYVMTSRFEGMPLVLLEAKSFGLPIVSFDCETGPRDIIRHNIDGFLVTPGNIDDMAKSLLTLMNNSEMRQRFSQESIIDSARFSIDKFYDKWNSIILE